MKSKAILVLVTVVIIFDVLCQGATVNLLVCRSSYDGVSCYDGITGEYLGDFISSGYGGLDYPTGITFGPDGHLYVASDETNSILRYNRNTGEFIDEFVTSGSGNLHCPQTILFGPDGNLYVADMCGDETILRYDGQTGDFINIFTSGYTLQDPIGMTFGPDGNLYVSSDENSRYQVIRFNGITGEFIDAFAGEGLDGPAALIFGPDGNLYVADRWQDKVKRYNGQTGSFIDDFVTYRSGGLYVPEGGLLFGPDGNLYVASYQNGKILRYDGQTGNFIDEFATPTFPTFFVFSEPATPPIADADGPYIVEVGDTLTLDASGSMDDDNDIVSYTWDLDDNGSFETDAGGQAIFDVNYTYLQSLGLLVNHTYNIHLKVTDSQQQSDVNDSTLTIVPKPALVVAVDIKPGSCPNPLNVKSSGVLPVAILGTEDLDVSEIVPTSIRLAGVEAIRNDYEDVAAPVADTNDCNCTEDGPDGYLDLTLKFETAEIVEAISEVNDGDVLTLELTGVLFGERPIEGTDCVVIRGRHKPINPADINKDGVVNNIDFAIIAENWLQSSVIED